MPSRNNIYNPEIVKYDRDGNLETYNYQDRGNLYNPEIVKYNQDGNSEAYHYQERFRDDNVAPASSRITIQQSRIPTISGGRATQSSNVQEDSYQSGVSYRRSDPYKSDISYRNSGPYQSGASYQSGGYRRETSRETQREPCFTCYCSIM